MNAFRHAPSHILLRRHTVPAAAEAAGEREKTIASQVLAYMRDIHACSMPAWRYCVKSTRRRTRQA